MIPVGYLYKKIAQSPDWLQAEKVRDIYSVSDCVSDHFADYINFWKHNGYWLFDSPTVLASLASDHGIDLAGQTLFYYEAYEYEFSEKLGSWSRFDPEPSFKTGVVVPAEKYLHGFDVSTFFCGNIPEHSPLSCNALARELLTNSHCLFETFDEAKTALDDGKFNNSERGPFRILAVHTLEPAG